MAEPLVAYRVHGKNQGAMARIDPRRFSFELERARFRLRFARSVARGASTPASDEVLDRSLTYLPYRLASLKLLPEQHPIAGDASWRLMRDMTAACFTPQGVRARSRALLWIWAGAVAASPAKWGSELVLWRFAPMRRPAFVARALGALRVVKRYQAVA